VLTAVHHKTTVMAAGQLLARNSSAISNRRARWKNFPRRPRSPETVGLSARLDFNSQFGLQFPKYPGTGETMIRFSASERMKARASYRPYHESPQAD
jgi:hypothetical protein